MIYDTVVIGGGPGGLASAIKAKELGLNVLLLDENDYLGGILPQCIHPGFGVRYFKEELTGPEFSSRFVEKLKRLNVQYILNATVLNISVKDDDTKVIRYVSPRGMEYVTARSIIYAAGARERHRFEIGIVGDRVAGVFTAGEAQMLMDVYGVLPGKDIVIVGSGDVGLIMARRFALEGANVKAVIELLPYPGGLARNVVQCLNDFEIPLYLSHKVLRIEGKRRVERVKVLRVDENLNEIPNTEFYLECDTVIISAGLIPRVKLLRNLGVEIDPATGGPAVNEYFETSVRGVFAIGNSLLINDLVDYVVEQGENAAVYASEYLSGHLPSGRRIKVGIEGNLRFVVPQYISGNGDIVFYGRVKRPMENATLMVREVNKKIRYPIVKPAEMIKFRLTKLDMNDLKSITLEVL